MKSHAILVAAAALLASAAAQARLPRAVTDLGDPAARAVSCAAYLGHEINAVRRAQRPPLLAALHAWRTELERRSSRDEAAQYFASTFAVLRDAPSRTRHAAAAYCRAHAPR